MQFIKNISAFGLLGTTWFTQSTVISLNNTNRNSYFNSKLSMGVRELKLEASGLKKKKILPRPTRLRKITKTATPKQKITTETE